MLEAEHSPLNQVACPLETRINQKRTRYNEVKVEQLPFFFGEHSSFCPKHLHFFNQLDDSVQGMHLCLDLLEHSHPVPSPEQIGDETKLVLINYSCSGWSLRLQLLPGRNWLVSDGLVF